MHTNQAITGRWDGMEVQHILPAGDHHVGRRAGSRQSPAFSHRERNAAGVLSIMLFDVE